MIRPVTGRTTLTTLSGSVLILLLVSTGSVMAQKPVCGNHNDELKEQLKGFTYENLLPNASRSLDDLPVYEIPVVVHIFHDNDALGSQFNPSDATIRSIIDESSKRFRHQHPGAKQYANPFYGVDTRISLCMARRDPSGHLTTGIVRYNNPSLGTGNGLDLASSFLDYLWNQEYYCNIIIMRDLQDACGWYIGYIDATIYDSGCFWSGLVAHEIGHYFSLLHIFQSGNCLNNDCNVDGDQICDTPAKSVAGGNGATVCDSPNNTCMTDEDDPSVNNPYRAISAGGMGEQPDMLANYMDFTGGCWDSFTEGQKGRMRANIEQRRTRMVNSPGACTDHPDQVLVTQCYDIASNASNQATTTSIHFENDVIPASISTSIELSIYVYGYIPFSSSTFAVRDENGVLLGETNDNNSGYTCFSSPDFSIDITAGIYNDWMTDGSIDFVLDPTSTFYPFGCVRAEICIQFKINDQDCTGDYFDGSALTGPLSENQVYLSNSRIESAQMIQGTGNNVEYQSSVGIELFPNFTITNGNVFQASIGGCNE